MKRLIMLISIIAAVFVVHITAFAMEPTTGGFTVVNKDATVITVNVSSEDYSENFTINGTDSRYLSYEFSEPGIYEYRVKRTDKSTDKEYVIQFCIIADDDGKLQAYVVPRIAGELEKPTEVSFGSPPVTPEKQTEQPKIDYVSKTGDNTNINNYILIAMMATAMIALLIWLMVRRNAGNNNQDKAE